MPMCETFVAVDVETANADMLLVIKTVKTRRVAKLSFVFVFIL